jgi:hypothetical protein
LLPIEPIAAWISPRLAIRFESGEGELKIYRPDNRPFLSFVELEQRAIALEASLQSERQRSQQMADYLRSLGVDPDRLP